MLGYSFSNFYIKHFSPSTNPAILLGFIMVLTLSSSLITGIVLGKAKFRFSDKPFYIEALMFIIYWTFFMLDCVLLLSNSTGFLNNKKSALFSVIKGYLIKCGIIKVKSLKDWT